MLSVPAPPKDVTEWPSDIPTPNPILRQCHTVFLINDNASMGGAKRAQTHTVLEHLAYVCTNGDAEGIDLYFVNHANRENGHGGYREIKSADRVLEVFENVKQDGFEPAENRLWHILSSYIQKLEDNLIMNQQLAQVIRPLNVIFITDSASATDKVRDVIVNATRWLDRLSAQPRQMGIQFLQIGGDDQHVEETCLRKFVDDIPKHGGRDMANTFPFIGKDVFALNDNNIMKAAIGAIDKEYRSLR